MFVRPVAHCKHRLYTEPFAPRDLSLSFSLSFPHSIPLVGGLPPTSLVESEVDHKPVVGGQSLCVYHRYLPVDRVVRTRTVPGSFDPFGGSAMVVGVETGSS